MPEVKKTVTLMGDAFARAQQRIHSQAPRPTIRDRLSEERIAFEGMSDDDLAFEATSLAQNIENVRIELRAEQQGEVERGHGWQVRAERAVAMLRGRAALCKNEQDRRRKFDEEERSAEEEQRKIKRRAEHEEFLKQNEERKRADEERRQANSEKNLGKYRDFALRAEAMLPKETIMAIWASVDS
jgi:hypothetical protein